METPRRTQNADCAAGPQIPPLLLATAFTDFICPFCYIGHVRLLRLRDRYDLRVNWCLLEIHPDNPPEGRPIEDLGYPKTQWRQMMDNLERMADEEGLVFAPRRFTTNSRRALLLAEAAKDEGRDAFDALADAVYRAYFTEGRNIGDEAVLRGVAKGAGLPDGLADRAWSDSAYDERLQGHMAVARRAGVRGTPTFIIGRQLIPGAVSTERLLEAAAAAA
jgi:predicted DsbA family dithiol-disulfide isomerase